MTDRLHWRNFFSEQRPIQVRSWMSRSDHYAHDHDFYELVVITAGKGDHLAAGGATAVAAGDLILLAPGVWHEYRDCASLCGFDCCFGKELLYREFAWITDDPVLGSLMLRHAAPPFHRQPVIGRIDRQRLAQAAGLLEGIADPPDAHPGGRRTAAGPQPVPALRQVASRPQLFGSLLVVLGFFADAVRAQVGGQAAPAVSPALKALTQRALALLGEDLTREWSLPELAKNLGTSPGFLSRAFRAVVGRSPMAHYAHCRMEHAAMLLLRSELPIAEIGARAGIFDANYFSRRFRAEMGMRPSDYRRRFSAGEA